MKNYYHELYQIETELTYTERKIVDTSEFRYLKELSQCGINSYFSGIKYNRFLHSMGVFSLTSYFHPGNYLLRTSALCHDLGHIAFSHSSEYATNGQYCHKSELVNILKNMSNRGIFDNFHFDYDDIIHCILHDKNNPLSNTGSFVSHDHLDSFINDAYFGGYLLKSPAQIIKASKYDKINLTLDFSIDDAIVIQEAIIKDNARMFGMEQLYREAIFARLLTLSNPELIGSIIKKNIKEPDILGILLSFGSYKTDVRYEAVELIEKFIRGIPEIMIKSSNNKTKNKTLTVHIDKVYNRRVLAEGRALDEIISEYKSELEKINKLKGTYVFN